MYVKWCIKGYGVCNACVSRPRMSFLWKQRTQEEKEQKKNLEEVNQLLLESILPTKVSKYYMEEDQSAVCSTVTCTSVHVLYM